MEKRTFNMIYALVIRGELEYTTIYRDDMAEMVRDYWSFGYNSAEMEIRHLHL